MIYISENTISNQFQMLSLGPITAQVMDYSYISGKKEYNLINFICCDVLSDTYPDNLLTVGFYGLGVETGRTTFSIPYGSVTYYYNSPTKIENNTVSWYFSIKSVSGVVDFPNASPSSNGQFNSERVAYYYWALTDDN